MANKGMQCIYSRKARSKYMMPFLCKLGFYNRLSDKAYLQKCYKVKMGRPLDLENPQLFSEKMQWLKLYDRKAEYTTMVDKIKAKEYVGSIIGEEHIIPLLGEWDNADDIDFDALPEQFVIKCNHNSGGGLCICKDKKSLDTDAVRKDLRDVMRGDYYAEKREWPYKDVQKKIFAEQYMVDESGTELKDYKLYCFNGEPKLVQIDYQRFSSGHRRNFYSPSWEFIDVTYDCANDPNANIPRPKQLDAMISIARTLANNIPFLRVDLYCVYDQIYFGELTFFPTAGFYSFMPIAYESLFGSWIHLPAQPQ